MVLTEAALRSAESGCDERADGHPACARPAEQGRSRNADRDAFISDSGPPDNSSALLSRQHASPPLRPATCHRRFSLYQLVCGDGMRKSYGLQHGAIFAALATDPGNRVRVMIPG